MSRREPFGEWNLQGLLMSDRNINLSIAEMHLDGRGAGVLNRDFGIAGCAGRPSAIAGFSRQLTVLTRYTSTRVPAPAAIRHHPKRWQVKRGEAGKEDWKMQKKSWTVH
ncbi:MAG: hypothetical protein V4726_22305 [Verrucomicrobiota bacterium]